MTTPISSRPRPALDHFNDATVFISPAGNAVWVDEALCHILEMTDGPDAAPPPDVLARIQFDGDRPLADVVSGLPAVGEWTGEAVGRTARDHAVLLEVKGRRLEPVPGETVGAVLRFRDATGGRVMERRVLESQQMELVDKLTRGLAHELKNLLTITMAYGSLLEMQLQGGEGQEEVAKIMETSDRANEVIQRLVSVTRMPRSKIESMDPRAIMIQTNLLLLKTLPTHVTLKADEPDRLPMIQVDPGRLIRAIVHLALNAAEAMGEEGTLRIGAEAVEIRETDTEAGHAVSTPGPYVEIQIADTGIGMAPDVQSRVFEPFFTTKAEGSGLGMCFVRDVVEDVGGSLQVSSLPGEGTTIRLYFPVPG